MSRILSKFIVLCHVVCGWRPVVALILMAALAVGVIFPTPAHAQFGLLGGIENILNIINGAIRTALNRIGSVSQSLQGLYQQVVWPVQLIDEARNAVASVIAQFRGAMHSIDTVAVNSATLPRPMALESIIRNHQTNDFPSITGSYSRAFGALPAAGEADPLARNMIDIDDSLALNTLKTLKATDQANDLVLESGNHLEEDARRSAPGSAPFLTAAAIVANIQSQAMMQKMLAAILRQEAARVAHENALRKRDGILVAKARERISNVLRRP
jgi:hypothetical protein